MTTPTTVSISDLGAVIKTAYEAQADTNAFTDAEKAKLEGLGDEADGLTADDIGVTVQAYDADLDALAALTAPATTLASAVQPGDLISSDDDNELAAPPPFWVGTETEYGALTPSAGTMYFVKADA